METKTEVFVHRQIDCLTICKKDKEEITRHTISLLKRQQVINNNHKRDHSKKLKDLIAQATQLFTDQHKAVEYLENTHSQMPRYTRNQVNLIVSSGKKHTKEEMDQALAYCFENNLTNTIDFEPVLLSLKKEERKLQTLEKEVINLQNSKPLIQPQTSSISDYKQIH